MGLVLIEIRVTEDVTPTLVLMVERMGDLKEPLTTILQDALFSAQEQVVEGKGSLFGRSRWDAMSEFTIKKGRDPGTLLVEEGNLLLSLSKGGGGNIFEVSEREGVAGTNLTGRGGFPYAAQQQVGNKAYPARPYLEWYEERFDDYGKVFEEWILPEGA
jgi:hypothetical protein